MLPYKKSKIPTWSKFLIGTLLMVGPALLLTLNILKTQDVTCNICINYEGTEVCKQASAPTRSDCERTGVDNACGSLALGMTNSLRCSSKSPTKTSFR